MKIYLSQQQYENVGQRLIDDPFVGSYARCSFHAKNGDAALDPDSNKEGEYRSSFFCPKCSEAKNQERKKILKKFGITIKPRKKWRR